MVAHSGAPLRPDRLRPLNVPRPVQVAVDARGRPTTVVLPAQKRAALCCEILDHWRIDDEWWRSPVERLYFDVMLEGGRRVTLFHDLIGPLAGGWFLQTTATPLPQVEPLTVLAPPVRSPAPVVASEPNRPLRRVGVA